MALLEKETEKSKREAACVNRTTWSQQNKKNLSGAASNPVPTTSNPVPTTSNPVPTTSNLDQNECSVCMGKYEDDFIDGELQNEWICCTGCGCWMHIDCLVSENSTFICVCGRRG